MAAIAEASKTYSTLDIERPKRPTKIFPWSFRSSLASTESWECYTRFKYFIEMGDDASLNKVAIRFGVSHGTIANASRKYQWRLRRDAYLEHRGVELAEIQKQERHNDHLERLESFRMRSEQVGLGLIGAGAQLLQTANISIAEMKKNGETLDRRLIAGALNASAKVAEVGRMLVAQSLGIDALMAGLDDATGESDPYS
jgi:hypothetical protein